MTAVFIESVLEETAIERFGATKLLEGSRAEPLAPESRKPGQEP
jgi:hypothetical protein